MFSEATPPAPVTSYDDAPLVEKPSLPFDLAFFPAAASLLGSEDWQKKKHV